MSGAFFPGSHVLLQIVVRTGVIYLLVLIGVRLSGKREVGQMTPFDLVLLLLLSNSVQNAMTGPDTSLVGGMVGVWVAATVLLVLNYFVADLSGANRRFRKFIQGQPSMLIHDGEVIEAHMAKEHVSMDDLERALRAHGISDYHQVAIGVLEVDGSISFLRYDDINPTAHTHLVRRKGIQKKQY